MKNLKLILGLGAAALGLAVNSANAGTWSVRAGATYLETIDKSDAFSALGINFAPDAVQVSDRTIPEIDVGYAFNDTWSAELVLTIPQEHKVNLVGIGNLGSFKHLPPTLLLQYRALPGQRIRPYASLGVNFTLIYDDELAVAGVPLDLESSSFGLAGQVGLAVAIDSKWTLDVNVKKAAIRTDVMAGGAALTEARLDPWLFGIGVVRRF